VRRIWANSRLRVSGRMLAVGACVSGIAALSWTYSRGGLVAFSVSLLCGVAGFGVWQLERGAIARCARSLLEAADIEQMAADQTTIPICPAGKRAGVALRCHDPLGGKRETSE